IDGSKALALAICVRAGWTLGGLILALQVDSCPLGRRRLLVSIYMWWAVTIGGGLNPR
ncbi:hypothetical protein BCR34DRAFT_572378, partial [Clohesyomyces aquaticus]